MSNLLFSTPKELTGWLAKLASGKRVMAPRQEGPSVVFRAYTAEELADLVWNNLNKDNKVSLFVRVVSLADGKADEIIINKNK